MVSRSKFLRLVRVYLQKQSRIPDEADRTPIEIAYDYDRWYSDTFVPWLASQLTMDGGRWSVSTPPTVIAEAGRRVRDGVSTLLVKPLTEWIVSEYPHFWMQGLDLWRVNMEMLDKAIPRKLKLTDKERDHIAILAAGEVATQSDHAHRHRRYVERMVQGGLSQGWTMERFVQASTARDGHIVAYPVGNSRYSWSYQMGLLIKGRSKAIAAAAQEYRMSR